jgi:hypothetical protein
MMGVEVTAATLLALLSRRVYAVVKDGKEAWAKRGYGQTRESPAASSL